MKEETYYIVDSLGVSHPVTVEQADGSVSQFFVDGGVLGMIVLTLLLIALISTFYGLIVYFISLIIRIIQKSRI